MCLYITHNHCTAINELQNSWVLLVVPLSRVRWTWYPPILIIPSVYTTCGTARVSLVLYACNCSLKNIFMLQVYDTATVRWDLNASKTWMTYTPHCSWMPLAAAAACSCWRAAHAPLSLWEHKQCEHGVSRLIDVRLLCGRLHLLCYRPDLLHTRCTAHFYVCRLLFELV